MPNVTKVEAPLHSPEQAREIMRTAIEIADELAEEGSQWEAVFTQACLLLGQKAVTFMAEPGIPALAIPRGNRH